MSHYYISRKKKGGKKLISDFIRGVTVEFETAPGLFSESEIDKGTKLLIEVAEVPEEGIILDMGCGYGAIGITLAKAYPRLKVYMVDINRVAVELAKLNAKRNGVEDRVVVLHGDLYEPIKDKKFDVILSNPPLAAGMKVTETIVTEAPHHLYKGGSLQVVLRKGHQAIANLMKNTFGNVEILASKWGYKVLKSTMNKLKI